LSVPSTKIDAIALALREYCDLHPRAADTLDGLRGWLPAEHHSISRGDLCVVVETLLGEGTLTRRTLGDGTVVYFSSAPSRGLV
jgi:hypothetical protein